MTVDELREALDQLPGEATVILMALISPGPMSNINYDEDENEVHLS